LVFFGILLKTALFNKSDLFRKKQLLAYGSTKSLAEHHWSNYEGQGVNEDQHKRRNLVFLQVARYSHKELPYGSFLLRKITKTDKLRIMSQGIAYNIYCDESRVENPESDKMVVGAISLPRNIKEKTTKELKNIYKKHNFSGELKWTKVNKNYSSFYKGIMDFVLKTEDLNFRCIIVDKSKVDYSKYHENDTELAFFKFYYLMLRSRLLDNNSYYIFLDKKPTRDKNRARALLSFLSSYVLLRRKECNIEHLQAYDSKDNIHIQLADFLTGLVAYGVNTEAGNNIKMQMVNYFKDVFLIEDLLKTTPLTSNKINILAWNPNFYEKGR